MPWRAGCSVRILESPITAAAAQAAGVRWLHGDRRTIKSPDVYLLMRHGGTYASKWRTIYRSANDAAVLWAYWDEKPDVRWGGLAIVHVHQPSEVVNVILFHCVPVRHRRAKGTT